MAVAGINRADLLKLDGTYGALPTTGSFAAGMEFAGALSEIHCEPVFHELDIPTSEIGGGTLEIQLNTIATFVLGLPRR